MSGRIYPSQGDGSDYVEILRTLKEMDYRGTISVEASTEDFEADCESAMQCLQKALLLAGWEY